MQDKKKSEEEVAPGTPETKRLDKLAKAIIARRRILEDKEGTKENEGEDGEKEKEKEKEEKESAVRPTANGHVSAS